MFGHKLFFSYSKEFDDDRDYDFKKKYHKKLQNYIKNYTIEDRKRKLLKINLN